MKTRKLITTAAAALAFAALNAAPIGMDTVYVGDPGNPVDVGAANMYGSVDYGYYIGTYEVTNAQYVAFLNSVASVSDPYGLYNPNMSSSSYAGILRSGSEGNYVYSVKEGAANNPVNCVSFWDAARFCNWLTTGDTETGVYMLNGVAAPENSLIVRNEEAWQAGGVALPSQDEWYKAAFYNPETKGYYKYATSGNTIGPDDANYGNNIGRVTEVGAYDAASAYGAYDMSGNLWEWNDTIFNADNGRPNYRGYRGGCFNSAAGYLDSQDRRSYYSPTYEVTTLGFRVASLAPIVIPESSVCGAFFGVAVLGFAAWRAKGA